MEDPTSTYRILRLIQSNFMKIKALDITPERNINRIAGKNRAGKTSVLSGIQAAFASARMLPVKPVRDGADEAEILCVLGDKKPELLVKRVIGADGKNAVEITTAEGYKAGGPQGILDDLYNKIAFDPQAFLLLPDDKQLELVRELVGLDFGEIDAKRKSLYDERTLVNRDQKTKAAQAESIVVPEGTPPEEVSVMDLMVEQKRRQNHNQRNQAERDRIRGFNSDVTNAETLIKRCEATIADLEHRLAKAKSELEAAEFARNTAIIARDTQQLTIDVLEDADVDEVSKLIIGAQSINKAVAAAKRKAEMLAEAERLAEQSKRLTTQIEAIDADKERQVASVKWPVEGMSFSSDGVLYNGIPFSQASGMEKIKVGFAMGAAMAPRLKVALVRNASLFDEEQLELFCQLAEERDMQVFLEICGDDSGQATVLIEDGLVTSGGNEPGAPLEIEKPKRGRKKKAVAEPVAAVSPFVSDAADDEAERNGTGITPEEQPELPFLD